MKSYGYIRLGIYVLVLLGCLLLIVNNIKNIVGIESAEPISSYHDVGFCEGNYVKCEYDCSLDGYAQDSIYFYSYDYSVIRLRGRDEYVYVATNSDDVVRNVDFYSKNAEASLNYVPEIPHTLEGKLVSFDNSLAGRESFKQRVSSLEFADFKMVNGLDNTNFDFFIMKMDVESEVKSIAVKVVVSIVFGVFLFVRLRKIRKIKEERKRRFEMDKTL